MWRKRSFRIRQGMLEEFTEYLSERENAESTIRKYNSDLRNFLDFMGAERKVTREEYERLRDMAQQLGKERLAMIIETIAGTGIRISELSFFTVKAIEKGQIRVRNKGKDRVILIPKALRLRLLYYIRKNGLREGTAGGGKADSRRVSQSIRGVERACGG